MDDSFFKKRSLDQSGESSCTMKTEQQHKGGH